MKQHEAVLLTIEKLGGIATLGQINQEIFKIKDCTWGTKTPFASIRRVVQLNPDIYKIKPGLYALKKFSNELEGKGIIAETEKNKNSKELIEFNHSYYQGLLLSIGKLKHYDTFIPHQDKNKRFLQTKLSEMRTLEQLPQFSYSNLVQRSSTIDVIWFNDRKMPTSFFEIEHSTDIQNSLLKYNDLQDFHVRMVIVADKSRRTEYENKIRYSAFKEILQRSLFIDYEILSKQYETLIEQQHYELLL